MRSARPKRSVRFHPRSGLFNRLPSLRTLPSLKASITPDTSTAPESPLRALILACIPRRVPLRLRVSSRLDSLISASHLAFWLASRVASRFAFAFHLGLIPSSRLRISRFGLHPASRFAAGFVFRALRAPIALSLRMLQSLWTLHSLRTLISACIPRASRLASSFISA